MAKGPEAFRTISEAADEIGVPQHVLRFWESKFSFIRPMKRAGGRRFYRPQDIAVLSGVRRLLHDEHYTIKGVQKMHREEGVKRLLGEASDKVISAAPAAGAPAAPTPPVIASSPAVSPGTVKPEMRGALSAALSDLEAAKARLDGLLKKS